MFHGSRKYVQRQKSLKKAFSWWEDEDENPDIAYKDFSRRKLLFDFGAHRNRMTDIRRNSDVSICTFKMDKVGVRAVFAYYRIKVFYFEFLILYLSQREGFLGQMVDLYVHFSLSWEGKGWGF